MSRSLRHNLIGICSVFVMIVFVTITDKPVKIILGAFLAIALIISLIQMQRSVELTNVQKIISWTILIPLGIILLNLFFLTK